MLEPDSKRIEFSTFLTRPNYGRIGKPFKVRTNFFEIKNFSNNIIFQYDISFTRDLPPKVIKKIYDQLLLQYGQSHFGPKYPVFDGRRNIYSIYYLRFGEATSLEVILPEDRKKFTSAPKPFVVKIQKVREINLGDLHAYLGKKALLGPNILSAISSLEIVLRYKSTLDFINAGRSFYIGTNPKPISGCLEIWKGFYQSCKPTVNKLLINIDTSATCFYQPLNLIDFVLGLLNKRDPHAFNRDLSVRDFEKISKSMKGLQICVTHRGETSKKFKIIGVASKPSDRDFFTFGDPPQEISIAHYFNQKYRLRLKFPFMPCVIVNKKGNRFPLEVCNILPGQRYLKKLNERQTSEMIRYTVCKPNERANIINEGFKTLNYQENSYAKDFGIEVDNNMLNIDARRLPAPEINYNPLSEQQSTFIPQNGSWNMRGLRVAEGSQLVSWAIIVFKDRRGLSEPEVQRFVRELVITCQDTGMDIPSKQPPIIYINPQGNLERDLKSAWLKTGDTYNYEPQLLLCILPDTSTSLYAEIKRVCDTYIGVISQCVQMAHVLKPNKAYCANVCLKINTKLGGMNSYVSPQCIPFIAERPTIVMGADISHAGPGDTSRPSIASLAASIDFRVNRYYGTTRLQAGRSEVIAGLQSMVMEVLKTFYGFSGHKPERILFYRDGVSDGQFAQVLEAELKAIKNACRTLQIDYKPSITFIVVKKRHHARFFPLDKADQDNRSGNLLAGTVIDSGVTDVNDFDFYLQSHAGLQGTCRPAHYHILYDDIGFTADSIQSLTNNLTYLFSRCTKSVSIVPPIYYAHLIGSRARFHSRNGSWSDIESETSQPADIASYGTVKDNIARTMYYI